VLKRALDAYGDTVRMSADGWRWAVGRDSGWTTSQFWGSIGVLRLAYHFLMFDARPQDQVL